MKKTAFFVLTKSLYDEGFDDAWEALGNAQFEFIREFGKEALTERIEFENEDSTYIFTVLAPNKEVLKKWTEDLLHQAHLFDFYGAENEYESFIAYHVSDYKKHPELTNTYILKY